MTHGSLFSGIGGFDLAAEWSGWENLFNCEWEEFPRKVLKHHFPNAKQYEDIKDFNATNYNGRIDVLSGGFPCQPFSTAGLRKGTEDERHLWPEMLRIIRECKPRWVVGENVRGLVSWSDGLVLETCCTDLEALGYSVQSFIIPACSTGAPHRRDRIWIVAHREDVRQPQTTNTRRKRAEHQPNDRHEVRDSFNTNGRGGNTTDTERVCIIAHAQSNGNKRNMGATQKQGEKPKRKESRGKFERNNQRNAPNTDSTSRKGERINRQGKGESVRRDSKSIQNRWENFPTVPPICGGDDGLPKELDGITFSKWRRESIKAYGNAIVPQVAHRIFQSINDYENDTN
jgi:DNA (cytosine-5)-methyltransferase 1